MTTQYVGARYVPLFFNQNGSNAWISNYAYEPLTIVTYNNVSYTSSQEVPANVGNPAENPEYWVATGNFAGQVLGLQTQIDTINTTLENNQPFIDQTKDIVILIGDSYAGYPSYTQNWQTLLEEQMSHWTVVKKLAYFGSGFYQASSTSGKTFLTAFQQESIENPSSITKIIVVGGPNDSGATYTQVTNAIAQFLSYCKVSYPNATVYIGTAYCGVENHSNFVQVTAPAYRNGSQLGSNAVFISRTDIMMVNWQKYVAADNVHPTLAGATYIANCLKEFFRGGLPQIQEAYGNDKVSVAVQNENAWILLKSTVYTLSSPIQVTGNPLLGVWLIGNVGINIGKVYGDCNTFSILAICKVNDSFLPCRILLLNGQVYINVDNQGSPLTITTVTLPEMALTTSTMAI